MEVTVFGEEFKPDIESTKSLCRCCLSTDRPMKEVLSFQTYFKDLAGLDVSEWDGLPQTICVECCALLHKATRFKRKMLRAHSVLYQYLTRCAPFPMEPVDPELSAYAEPHLSFAETLLIDTTKTKSGYHKVLQHKKREGNKMKLKKMDISVTVVDNDGVKEEIDFDDYEDNISLEQFRANKVALDDVKDDVTVTRDDLHVLEPGHEQREQKHAKAKRKTDKQVRVKKKTNAHQSAKDDQTQPERKSSVRKAPELDPAKIRVIALNPEEQVRQREEESKTNLKYPFQCHLCFKGFNFESKLQNHMNKHSPSRGPYACRLCAMHLPTAHSHAVHSLIHTRRYECVQCGVRMIDRASIYMHYRSQHEGVVSVFTCHVCGKASTNYKTHRGHLRNHHGGERPTCDACGKTFVNKDSLAEHIQIHQGVKNYECSVCNKRFRTRSQIKQHQLKHTDVKQYYCVECDVRFKSEHNLKYHLQKSMKHKDTHSFKHLCSRCDKRFESPSALESHVAVAHLGVRAHLCASCPAALASRSSLAKHVARVHGGKRPPPRHVCHTCGKAFTGKSVLTNHVRTHTGEKPFACATCGRTFTQRASMRTHVKLVHLKVRRSAKVKPEMPEERAPSKAEAAMFPKEETPLFDGFFYVAGINGAQ